MAINALVKSDGFMKKKLGSHVVNPAYGCANGCLYCYAPSAYRYQLGTKTMVIHDPELFLQRLKEQLSSSKEKSTAILSTATDPFLPEIADTSKQAMEMLIEAGWTVRVITKRIWDEWGNVVMPFGPYPEYQKQVIFNISLGCISNEWSTVAEPKADAASLRLELIRSLIDNNFRVAVMACPIPPNRYEETFKRYCEEGILDGAEEVFCEIINPRGSAYKELTEHFPEIGSMMNAEYRSLQSMQLIETAHGYVRDWSKLRVLTYTKELLPAELVKAKDFPGVVLL